MRVVLILSWLFWLLAGSGVTRAAEVETAEQAALDARTARAPVAVRSVSSPGSTLLTIRDSSDLPFSTPAGVFVVLPPGAAQPRVRLAGAEEEGSLPSLSVGEPMILRGLRVLPITVRAAESKNGDQPASAAREIAVDVRYQESGLEPAAASRPLSHARGFLDALGPLVPAEQQALLRSDREGSYLIITAPQYVDALAPLVAWKTEKGLRVTVATTDETGTRNDLIRDYIAQRYHDDPIPPEYVLLVGDVDKVPSWDFHQSVSDHPYAMVDGDDFLPDLFVGRLSVADAAQAQVVVDKIIGYERDPFVDAGSDWFRHGLMVAGNSPATTPTKVCNWVAQELGQIGYSQVDSVYNPPYYNGAALIRQKIDRGVTIVTYRGWAQSIFGWETPRFLNADVYSLSNDRMLPVVFSFVCNNNSFNDPQSECFGEAWLRAGDRITGLKGAVAFIGNSEPWSHTMLNDAICIATTDAICRDGVRKLGAILNASKVGLLAALPNQVYYADYEDWSVEQNFYIYNLLGDPEMEMLVSPPDTVHVSHVDPIPLGSNFLDVTVTDEGGAPVAGARVAVSSESAMLGCAWTDEAGVAHVPATFAATGAVRVTVTGSGVFPYRGTAQVAVAQSFLAVEGWTIDDDASGQSAGNGDGALNPGETVELSLTIRNQGSANADAVTASLNALHGAEVVTGSADYGDLPAGAQGEPATPFVIRIPKDAENASAVQLQLEVTAGGQRSSTDATLNVVAPSLIHESAAYAGDGVLLPGETSDLAVTVRNDGAVGTDGFEAVLRTLDPALVAIVDSTVSYGAAAPGASITGSEAFVVEASDEAAQGQAARFTLRVTTAEGFESETSFSAMVGTANVFAPLGPDTYGYYAYDSADTDYPDTAPVYDWISCSTAYGGTGTKIMTGGNATMGDNTLKLIDLPFPFTFYREAHNQILVSDNGWVSFETTPYYDYYNWHMPTTYGNGSTIAVFWDNLDPVHTVNDRMICDGVYTFYDPDRHAFVIEWSRLANYEPDYDDLQTFELILFDPAFHPTPTGDGMFQMQYKQVKNNDNGRAFSTVGIEDPTEQIGLEYTFGNLYPATAAPLSSGLAIRFTTQPPRYSPFRFASFRAEPAGGSGVALSWEPIDERPRAGTRIYRARPGGDFALVSGPVRLDPATRSFVDEAADPDSTYSYKVGSLDTYGRETIVGPFEYAPGASGSSHLALSLVAKTAVPFRGSCDLTYQLPRAATVQLRVHDLSGRVVRTLVSERHNAGKWDVTWDGRDDAGRDLPSGIYYCKLAAGSELRTMKLTLLR